MEPDVTPAATPGQADTRESIARFLFGESGEPVTIRFESATWNGADGCFICEPQPEEGTDHAH